ncbi:unnamed protein product [Peniophora sp. CBMAI 1063]|nr:unnamed protein product [Peniophora sp. CBMAI 1063]
MSSRSAGQDALFKYVEGFAHDPDDALVERCRAICQPYNHPFIGPVLQYKVDDYNLGRHLVFCKGTHPDNPDNPGRVWMPVSPPLTIAQRRLVREFRDERGLRADGTLVAKKVPTLPKKAGQKKKKKKLNTPSSEIIDISSDTAPPSPDTSRARLARSPSVEIIRVVPAPVRVLHDKLDIWYFSDNEKLPVSLTLKARPARQEFRFRQYEDVLLSIELKQTDAVMVLTTAIGGIRTWSTFRVSDLMIPRTQCKIVLARPRVQTPHSRILDYEDHAYPGAASLSKRILPLP